MAKTIDSKKIERKHLRTTVYTGGLNDDMYDFFYNQKAPPNQLIKEAMFYYYEAFADKNSINELAANLRLNIHRFIDNEINHRLNNNYVSSIENNSHKEVQKRIYETVKLEDESSPALKNITSRI